MHLCHIQWPWFTCSACCELCVHILRVQVYKAVLRETGEEVAVKVQRPGIEPIIMRDLFIFRAMGSLFNAFSQQRLGCNAELVVDEFGEKLLEELDYNQVGACRTRLVVQLICFGRQRLRMSSFLRQDEHTQSS